MREIRHQLPPECSTWLALYFKCKKDLPPKVWEDGGNKITMSTDDYSTSYIWHVGEIKEAAFDDIIEYFPEHEGISSILLALDMYGGKNDQLDKFISLLKSIAYLQL